MEINPTTAAQYHVALTEGVRNAIDELLTNANANPIDAIVCCDDASALSAPNYLQELGR